jgi:lysophospholipase L1-like esterase
VNELPLGKKILFSLLPAVVLFGGLELTLRALGIPQEMALLERYEFPPPGPVNVGFEDDVDLFWRLRPGYDGPWTYWRVAYTHEGAVSPVIQAARRSALPDPSYRASVRWQVNRDGYRGTLAPDCRHCVLFVGSSITFGWAVKWEDSFSGRLASRLHRAGLDDWAVIDAGVPGYSSYQSLIVLRRWLERAPVRAVVFEAGVNDGMLAPVRADRDLALMGRPRHESHWWSRSHLFLWLQFALRDALAPPAAPPPAGGPFYATSLYRAGHSRVSPEHFLANLASARALAAQHGAALYVLIPGLYNEEGDGRLQKSARYQGPDEIPVVDALEQTAAGHLERYFLPYDEAHFSPWGHALVARLIWERLQRDGVLPSAPASVP